MSEWRLKIGWVLVTWPYCCGTPNYAGALALENPHCRFTEDCLFMLFMSLNDIRRLMLPTLAFRPVLSSPNIFWVFSRGFGRLGTTAPALRVKSAKNDSRSEANFRSAFSKSASLRLPVPLSCTPLTVTLLLLLSVPLCSGDREIEAIESRASSESLESRL